MSVDLTVYLARAKMPTPVRWAKAIREAGFPADLDADFDVDKFSGFLPCAYDGKPGGFEYLTGQVLPGTMSPRTARTVEPPGSRPSMSPRGEP